MKNILITGGAGFIGSNLADTLLTKGNYKVTVIDNFDSFYSEKIKRGNISHALENGNYSFVEGNILNIGELSVLQNQHFDSIVHIAAKAGVRSSFLDPQEYQRVNVEGTRKLLDWSVREGIKKIVYASSSSIYGINTVLPWNENAIVNPISPYALTKLEAEKIGYEYTNKYDIKFLALRFFTVYGPRQRPDLAISKFTRCILKREPIPFFGDGSTKRDYTFIEDIVDGIIKAIDYNKTNYEIINLGNSNCIDLNELISILEKTTRKHAILNQLPEQKGDVPFTYADISKAKELLGYNPATGIEKGIEYYIQWLNTQTT